MESSDPERGYSESGKAELPERRLRCGGSWLPEKVGAEPMWRFRPALFKR